MAEECVFSRVPLHGCLPLLSAAAGGLARLLAATVAGAAALDMDPDWLRGGSATDGAAPFQPNLFKSTT